MNKLRTLYLGYDINTVMLINNNKDFKLIGIAVLPELLEYSSLRFGNYIFKMVYLLHIHKKHYLLQRMLCIFLVLISWNLSRIYNKYLQYLLLIIRNNIPVYYQNDISSDLNIDIIIVNNWWKISSELLALPKYGCINMHPSKLPMYRGSVPTLWALKNNDSKSAVSFFILDEKIDNGMIISQYDFPISPEDNSIDIEYKIEKIVIEHMLSDILKYVSGSIIPFSQNLSESSYTAKYYDYMVIDFSMEKCIDIINKILLYPFLNPIDICFFRYRRKKIYVRNGCLSQLLLYPGEVVVAKNYIHIGCKDNISIKFKLFVDINFFDSIYLIINSNDNYRTTNYCHKYGRTSSRFNS